MFINKIRRVPYYCMVLCLILFSSMSLSSCSSDKFLDIHSSKYLNPNIFNKSSPVVLKIFILKRINKFLILNKEQLLYHGPHELQHDLVKVITLEVRPNTIIDKKLFLIKNAKYIAIIADFRNQKKSNWKVFKKINILQKKYKIVIIKNNLRIC